MKIHAGSTGRMKRVFIQDSTSGAGAGLTGLTYSSAGLKWYYTREGAATASAVTLATAALGTFTDSGFKEVDSTNMPGVYEIGLPDAAIAAGTKSVAMFLSGATNMVPIALEIELDAVDYQDAVRFGISALPNAAAGTAGAILTAGTGTAQIASTGGGVGLAATGLDAIPATAPTTVATTFPQMLVQMWRRFHAKVTLTPTQLRTFADDGTTIVTTQTVANDGTTETQGPAA